MNETILVTGATGKVGSHLVRYLNEAGAHVRAGVHDPAKAEALAQPGVELAPLDFDDPASLRAALTGVDRLALITPASNRQVDWAALATDLAKEAGVRHIVRLSVLAAGMEPGIQLARWHRIAERYIQGSGLDWTIIRPSPFMQNFLGLYPSENGKYDIPLGNAKVTHIDVSDVADVLALALTQPGHEGKTHMVTGGEPLTMEEATRILANASQKAVAYRDTPASTTKEAMLKAGRPAWLVDILMELFAAIRSGAVGGTLPTFQALTGRAPKRFETFAASA